MKNGFKEFMLVICDSCGWTTHEKGSIVCMWVPEECEYQVRTAFDNLTESEKYGYIQMANNMSHSVWVH